MHQYTDFQRAYFKWTDTRDAADDMEQPYFMRQRAMKTREAAWQEYAAVRDGILESYKAMAVDKLLLN